MNFEEKKTIVPVISQNNITIKKKPFTQKFKEAFISQDFKTAAQGVNNNVIIPAIKRVIADAISNTINSILFGTSAPTGFKINPSTWSWNGITYNGSNINYSGISKTTTFQQQTTQVPNTGAYKWDEIIICPDASKGETMADAERHADDIMNQLRAMLERFGQVSINDFFDTCSLPMNNTLGNYGWNNLRDMDKVMIPNTGFWIKLPSPVLLR